MADSQPKFKFKKRSKASLKKKQLRNNKIIEDTENNHVEKEKVGNDDDHHNEVEDEPSALHTIMAVEKRRKLLSNRNRGVDASTLGKQTIATTKHESSETTAHNNTTQNEDLDERLNKSFAGGKLAGSNDMGGDDDGGILAKKHRLAMESYVEQNLNNEKDANGNNNESDEKGNKSNTSQDEKELYAELLSANESTTNNNEGAAATAVNKEAEGDVGAGGAMMGGTGIAEVALPIDERIKALKETERMAMELEKAREAGYGGGGGVDGDHSEIPFSTYSESVSEGRDDLAAMVPMNFASGPGKRKRQDVGFIGVTDTQKSAKTQPTIGIQSSALPSTYSASSAGLSIQKSDVSALGASYSHNFQLHTKEWVSRKRDERQSEIEAIQAQEQAEDAGTTEESRKRLGFEMSRKLAKGEVSTTPFSGSGATGGTATAAAGKNEWNRNHGRNQQSNDDRVWKQFMSKSRNRR